MRIDGMVHSLKAGYRVRRDSWPEGHCIELYGDQVIECEQPGAYGTSSPYAAWGEDLLAVDWVLCSSRDQIPFARPALHSETPLPTRVKTSKVRRWFL